MKPVGPDYRRLLQEDLKQKGILQAGEIRQFEGNHTKALWIGVGEVG